MQNAVCVYRCTGTPNTLCTQTGVISPKQVFAMPRANFQNSCQTNNNGKIQTSYRKTLKKVVCKIGMRTNLDKRSLALID